MPIWPAMKAIFTASPVEPPLAEVEGAASLAAVLGAAALGAVVAEVPPLLLHAAARTMLAAPSARYRPNDARFTLLLLHESRTAPVDTAQPGPTLRGALPAPLIEVHREDQDDPHDGELVERLDLQDDEAVLEHDGDEAAEDRTSDRRDPAEQAGPSQDHGGDRLQAVGLMADHVGSRVTRDSDDSRDADEDTHEDEQAKGVAVDVDARADRRLRG